MPLLLWRNRVLRLMVLMLIVSVLHFKHIMFLHSKCSYCKIKFDLYVHYWGAMKNNTPAFQCKWDSPKKDQIEWKEIHEKVGPQLKYNINLYLQWPFKLTLQLGTSFHGSDVESSKRQGICVIDKQRLKQTAWAQAQSNPPQSACYWNKSKTEGIPVIRGVQGSGPCHFTVTGSLMLGNLISYQLHLSSPRWTSGRLVCVYYTNIPAIFLAWPAHIYDQLLKCCAWMFMLVVFSILNQHSSVYINILYPSP